MTKFKFISITLLLLVFMQSFTTLAAESTLPQSSTSVNSQSSSTSDDKALTDYIQSMIKMIRENYKGEIDEKKLLEGAMKGMLSSLDPYTSYFTAEESESFFGTISGSFSGIGVMIDKQKDYVVIVKVFPDSPAEKAGFMIGDKIAKVGDKDLFGATPEEVASIVRGPTGSSISISVIRENTSKMITLNATRAEIKISPVSYKIIKDIGYIKLDMFSGTAFENMLVALNEFDKKNIKKVVFDLRNNPGGLVDQAVSISQLFVPKGLITKLDYKSEAIPDQSYFSNLEKTKYKLVVLMNKNSASASEIFAGAVQDTKAGLLIGTNSYGKGVVQGMFPLLTLTAFDKYKKMTGMDIVDYNNMSQVLYQKYNIQPTADEVLGETKITIGEYTTPLGRSINGKGLQPDILVDDYKLINNIDVNNIEPLRVVSKPTQGNVSMDVFNAERILSLLGYQIDLPDNVYDEKSFEAVKKFQKDSKLYPYGVIDFATQKSLNQALEKLVLKLDTQLSKGIQELN